MADVRFHGVQLGSLQNLSRRGCPPVQAICASDAAVRSPRHAVRGLQIALGLIWLLDGALQLQPFMFGHDFVTEVLLPSAAGQPVPLARSITWSAELVAHHLVVFNVWFAAIQVAIGVGLLARRTVRPALVASFVWVALVWSLGEGFGMLLTGVASPLTGAPGAVLLYALIGVLAWPAASERTAAAGRRAGRGMWVALWCGAAVLWLLPSNRSANSVHDAIAAAAIGQPGWLATIQTTMAGIASGHGLVIAATLAVASGVIGLGVLSRRPAPFLIAGAVLSLVAWIVGQALGAILTGQATDPNAGPLFVLLAFALLAAARPQRPHDRAAHSTLLSASGGAR